MRLSKFGKSFIVFVCLMAFMGAIGGTVTAHSTTATNVTVDSANADPANGTYATIQNAAGNVTEGAHIKIVPDTYEENVTLEVNDTHFMSTVSGESVFVNGELNASHDNVTSLTIDDEVTFADGVLRSTDGDSGGISIGEDTDLLNDEFMGVPLLLWGLLIIVVGYVGYREWDER